MRTLNRPMFKMGGPIKEGVMHGIREPKNMGGWTFVRDFIEDIMAEVGMTQQRLAYAGRAAAASPAAGTLSRHNREQNDLVEVALDLSANKKT